MGDTAIGWALGVARICSGTNAGSPRSEAMRRALVWSTYIILKMNYDSSLEFLEYRQTVEKEMLRLSETFWAFEPGRTVESLFDTEYKEAA